MATKRKHPDKPTGIRFDPNTRRWLVEYAAENDLTLSQVVRRAVTEYQARVFVGASAPDSARKAGGA